MRRALAILLVLLHATPAAAGDDWLRADLPPAPRPAAPTRPPGLYYVTETYVRDAVIRTGPVTTYGTITERRSTGSYARVLAYVGTGVGSAYDGRSFNGRARMADGRLVAGTYYENFVPHGSGFRSVSIVFFQDDAEIARAAASAAPSARPVAIAAPSPTPRPAPTAAPVRPPTPAPPPVRTPAPRPSFSLDVGVALMRHGTALASFEVLRGRGVSLWPVATVDGRRTAVQEWWLVEAEMVPLGPTRGGATVPLTGRFDRLADPGRTWPVRLSVSVRLPDGTLRTSEARITALVRSPAVVD